MTAEMDRPGDQKRQGIGQGLLQGLGVTLKTMLKPAITQQYPHVKPDLPRARAESSP